MIAAYFPFSKNISSGQLLSSVFATRFLKIYPSLSQHIFSILEEGDKIALGARLKNMPNKLLNAFFFLDEIFFSAHLIYFSFSIFCSFSALFPLSFIVSISPLSGKSNA